MIGQTISHYRILEKLGEGGMGVVYKAEDTKLKRTVALKFLTPQALGTEEEKTRFVHEAQAAAALNHSNICTVYEIDESEGPTTAGRQSFIAMEYIEGQSLKEKVDSGPLKLDEAVEIAIQVSEGLQKAHDEGVVHRDIKSANIMVTEEGQAKIMDFGLAKLTGQTKLTKTGTTVGTIAYMSPEQARGEEIDHRTDIWSLGVVLYEMVTGQLPFKGEYEQAVVYSIMNEDPEPMTGLRTGVPMELERITNKALAKSPDERYQHVDDMAADLRKLKKDLESEKTAITTTPIPITRRAIWRQPFSILTAVVVVILLVYGWQRIFKEERQIAVSLQKSIAVMPFENLTGDANYDIWQKGIPELLITALSTSNELYVLGSQTMFDILGSMGEAQTTQIVPSLARQVASKLNVETVILGNILKAGDKLRIQVKLQDAESGKVLRSEMADGETEKDLFDMTKVLSDRVKDYLEIKVLEQDADYDIRVAFTSSAEAYRHYIKGMNSFYLLDYGSAIHLLTKAVEIDTNFTVAYFWLSLANHNSGQAKQTKKYFEIADRYKNRSPYKVQLMVQWLGALLDKKPHEEIEWSKRILEIDPHFRVYWFGLGMGYIRIEQYDQAVEPLEKAMELSFQWGSGWKWVHVYTVLGYAYHELGKHDREMEVYEKGLSVLPDHPSIIGRLAIEYLSRGDTTQGDIYLTKYQSKRKEEGWSKARITRDLGSIFWEADDLMRAEEFYRRALDMNPADGGTLNYLAYLLIDHDINVDEGMEFVQRALEIEPDNPEYLVTQGWGYYKQDKYQGAVDILQRAWNEYPEYYHDAYQHLQKAKSAIAKQ